jgi:thiamine biosynthesis lipoprotein
MSKLLTAAFYISLVLIIAGCKTEEKFHTEHFYGMGTFVSVTTKEENKDIVPVLKDKMHNLETEITAATARANETNNFCFTGLMQNLYETGLKYEEISEDTFSIFAYTIAKEYGFPNGPYRIPSQTRLHQLVENLRKMYDLNMDMGAYAKGYIVDRAIDEIKAKGITSAMVNAGGDLYALGNKGDRKWRVAIKHPDTNDEFLSIINISDTALATSGDYERFFEQNGQRYIHIFDANTGKNPKYYRSVSVIAEDTETADAMATVFFLLPPRLVEKKCKELGTPVLLYNHQDTLTKLCGWEKFENN